jgi:EAL domain-containing protein (putative c-di-GMP-specific phosphodiesterase class I)
VFAYEALMRLPSGYTLDGPQEAFDVADKLGRAPELDAICRDAILARARDVPADALLLCNLAPQSLEHPSIAGYTLLGAVEMAGIVAFAHNAGTFVIAEGIETPMMLDIIEQAGMPATGTGGVHGV